MSLTAQQLITFVSNALHDPANVRWPVAQLISFINLAQLQCSLVRPDLNAQTLTMQLVPGSKQQLPPNALQLFTIVCNMGQDGLTPGGACGAVERSAMDQQLSAWSAATPSPVLSIESYVVDDRIPNIFYVYPPPAAANPVYVEYIAGIRPTDLVLTSDTISFQDTLFSPMTHWILYLCMMWQLDDPTSQQVAQAHYGAFYDELGKHLQGIMFNDPRYSETYMPSTAPPAGK